jgi:hypothetical protein
VRNSFQKKSYSEEKNLQRGRGFKEKDSPLKVAFSKGVVEIQIHEIDEHRLEQLEVFRFDPNLSQATGNNIKWSGAR